VISTSPNKKEEACSRLGADNFVVSQDVVQLARSLNGSSDEQAPECRLHSEHGASGAAGWQSAAGLAPAVQPDAASWLVALFDPCGSRPAVPAHSCLYLHTCCPSFLAREQERGRDEGGCYIGQQNQHEPFLPLPFSLASQVSKNEDEMKAAAGSLDGIIDTVSGEQAALQPWVSGPQAVLRSTDRTCKRCRYVGSSLPAGGAAQRAPALPRIAKRADACSLGSCILTTRVFSNTPHPSVCLCSQARPAQLPVMSDMLH